MAINLTTPVTGAAQTGFTSPTYTIVGYVSNQSIKGYYVTALGGTQPNVTIHSASGPFRLEFQSPTVYRALGVPNPATGVISSIPKNVYRIRGYKDGAVNAQNSAIALATLEFSVPAGMDKYNPDNVKALVSLFIGALSNQSAGIGDWLLSGMQ